MEGVELVLEISSNAFVPDTGFIQYVSAKYACRTLSIAFIQEVHSLAKIFAQHSPHFALSLLHALCTQIPVTYGDPPSIYI